MLMLTLLGCGEDTQDPAGVKSRTGYIILVGDCPLVWGSKLQTEIALSTMEAEYVALSYTMRELLPLQRLIEEVVLSMGLPSDVVTSISSTVWEDTVSNTTGSDQSSKVPQGQSLTILNLRKSPLKNN